MRLIGEAEADRRKIKRLKRRLDEVTRERDRLIEALPVNSERVESVMARAAPARRGWRS